MLPWIICAPLLVTPTPSRPQATLPVVKITGIIANVDSVRVMFAPVVGAADYRIYEATHPERVKYAGIVHRFVRPGQVVYAPGQEIEWNGITPGGKSTLIVEAVDRLGPVPATNLLPEAPSGTSHTNTRATNTVPGMVMIGANSGTTPDGKLSTNGQGAPDAAPKVLARSLPFAVTTTGKPTLPSSPKATQILFDTFASGEISAAPSDNPQERRFTLKTSTADWDILFQGSDLRYCQPFVMDRHFMDILADGNTGGVPHTGHGASALSPKRTVDFSGGRILHLTMEVDAHIDGHRWVGFNLAPADDPLVDFYWSKRTHPVNRANQAFFCEVTDTTMNLGVIDGKTAKAQTVGLPGPIASQVDVRSGVITPRPSGNGRGLDNRSRFDLFVSRTRFALFEDGKLIQQGTIVDGIPFERAKVYYTHFLYRSADGLFVLQSHAPHEKYWIDHFPYSDERHWDNMGFEVLPASTAWTTLKQHLTISH